MAYKGMAAIVAGYTVMASAVLTVYARRKRASFIVIAHVVMAYVLVSYIVMAYIVLGYVVMASASLTAVSCDL